MCRLRRAAQGVEDMHDLLIALAFIGILVVPAIIAAKSASQNTNERD
jgi:hypothetical protein